MLKKVKRSEFATFMDVTPKETTSSYKRMGKGITSQTVSYNPQTVTETYIDEDNANTSVESYQVNFNTPHTAYVGEPVFDYVDGLRRKRATGSDCDTTVLMVYIYDKLAEGVYAAEKNACSIQVDDFGGDAGNPVVLNYTVNLNGDPTIGYVTITEGAITFTEGEYGEGA